MVDGRDAMEVEESSDGTAVDHEGDSREVVQSNGDVSHQATSNVTPLATPNATPTTTISTIAVQSGDTRLVIALLQSGEWLRLKVLEVQPELTKLGASVKEATELSNGHDEVLLRLQSKQSPVEELLRQADQLISTQKPRAEVYAAMAETLGQAWRDVNDLLERRKQILDCNVLFQCRAEECRENMRALEMACNDTLLPIEIEAVKNFLQKIHDFRKNMLEALMGALQEGKSLLDRLKEIVNEGTLDSRPDRIKVEADQAVLKVERWLEELHDRRRLIEASFRSRKTQLEQCLALALLATDLRDLDDILNDRIAALSSSCDQLGDSASSAELLLHELKKLQIEAKEFQDRSIKITKSTERLVSSGHFAGKHATEQAYAILGAAADYINDLDQYETLLNRAVAFFNAARSALTKLDQLEIQLVTTEHPPFSARLARFHAQTVGTIEEVTAEPLAEGYALLDITGRGAPGAEGVKRAVEELENRNIRLMERCTAHEAENLEISRAISSFLEKHEELRAWLASVAEAFLQGHQDMGSDLPMATDFHSLHRHLLDDIDKRTNEVEHLEFEILPIRERLEEAQWKELENKVKDLQDTWRRTRSSVANRSDLGASYIEFHEVAEDLEREVESIEHELRICADILDESKIAEMGRRWQALQPLYVKVTGTGKKFLDDAAKINDRYLDVLRASLCVQTLLEKLSNRQLTVIESWEKWRTSIEILKEKRIEHERKIEESTRTLQWVAKFGEQLYPAITSDSNTILSVLEELEGSKLRILPELNKAVDELEARIRSIGGLVKKEFYDDDEITRRLSQMHEKLRTTAKDYGKLLDSLIYIFESLKEVERKVEQAKVEANRAMSCEKLTELNVSLNELESTNRFISEVIQNLREKCDESIAQILRQEPPEAARQDIEKLKHAMEIVTSTFETFKLETTKRIEEHRRIATFAMDLERIDSDLRDLNEQLGSVDGRFADNLLSARNSSAAFSDFEKTIKTLEERIETFVKTTEETVLLTPRVQDDLFALQQRWRDVKKRVDDTRGRLVLSIQYFELLEEAKEWFREGSKLLIVIARKASMVKLPQDAMDLLNEIDNYLKPGEEIQDRRIERLKELSTIVFGTDRLPQFNEVVVENRQMLDSFAVVSSELRTLAQNLRNAEDLRERLRIEKLEADVKLQAAKAETFAAEAKREEAENARRVAEKLAAETLEKAAIEAQRLREERAMEALKVATPPPPPPSFSVSAQTEKIESTEEEGTKTFSSIHETINVTTEEIHILEKTEIEKTIQSRETSPVKEKVVEQETKHEETIVKEQKEEVPSCPPQFTVPLQDTAVQEGERLTFECHVIGHPIPEVIWYKDGISILNNSDYLTTYVHGVCTLTIEETFAEDSARYTCRAFNTTGTAETLATLSVKETALEEQLSPPAFVKELHPAVAKEGASYQLECTVQGNPLPTVQWYKNDTNIDNSPDYIITYNNGEALLKFEEVFLEDKATYACKATNRLGHATTSASLDVDAMLSSTEKPYFVVTPSNVMARAGQRVKLECEARGNPMPCITWSHDGVPVEETSNLKMQTDDGSSCLVIAEAFPKDAGCYTVTAKNDVGEATMSCNVLVKGRLAHETSDSEVAGSDMEPVVPKIQLPLKDLTVLEGRTGRLDCVIVGQPEPEVIWYRDNQPVKESADFQLLFQGDKCSLVIQEAFLDDAGVYKVVAINSGGEASSQCALTVTPVSNLTDGTVESHRRTGEILVLGVAPKFFKLPTDSLVAEGENAIFECAVTGEPKPELKWYLDSTEIVPTDRILIEEKEDHGVRLKISPTLPEDKGNYMVKATNAHGEAKAFARLIVRSLGDFRRKEDFVIMEEKLIAPIFKERFEDRTVPEGVTTKFECMVTGKPVPKIQWLFNDTSIHGKDFLVSVSGDRQVLTIPETESAHAGTISCVAENAAGRAVCSAKVHVGTRWKNEEVADGEEKRLERVYELIESTPADEMHASSSSEKHFTTEKTGGDGGGQSQILTKMSETITQSSSTHTSTKKEYVSSMMSSNMGPTTTQEPTSVSVKTIIQSSEHSTSQDGAPPVVQSHKVEEYEKIIQDQPGEIRQEKTVVVSQNEKGTKGSQLDTKISTTQVQKPSRKSTAPRFVSPIMGMIANQGTDIILEGIVDGFPQPTVSWSKNGQDLKDGMGASYAHNHVKLELKSVTAKDAGRYTCTASNEVGTASSTADLVVKKTIFPPVFGRRLQAQVVKRGERVIMEVEITGTPEPTVVWYKDDVPVKERPPELRIKQLSNCYTLIIEKAEKTHAGKYMVRATNAGGEAQSIADFAVFEPTPDTMVEVHKTMVYENIQDKKIIQPDTTIKPDVPSSAFSKTQQISSTIVQPSCPIRSVQAPSSTTIRTVKTVEEPIVKTCRSETISKTVESHQTETKSEQKFHMKLEHKTPSILETRPEATTMVKEVIREETNMKSAPMSTMFEKKTIVDEQSENENIETSTIARKDALSFFESMTKDTTDAVPKRPKEMIRLVDDAEGKGHEVKVGALTKNYERSTTYKEVTKPEPSKTSDYQATKKSVQDIFTKLEQGPKPRGVENKLFDFPCEEYKSPLMEMKKTIMEETRTTSGSTMESAMTMSKFHTHTESTEEILKGFNLVPEPPPEIGYMPKPEEAKKKRPDVSVKAKQLQESFDKTISPLDAPIGGVKIFPSPAPKPPPETPTIAPKSFTIPPPPFELGKKEVFEETCIKRDAYEKKGSSSLFKDERIEPPKVVSTPSVRPLSPARPWSSSSDMDSRSHVSTDISEYRCHSAASSHQEMIRPTSPRPSADALAMEKSWAKKCADSNRKSWPPHSESTFMAQKQEWQSPGEDYKTSSKEFKQEVEQIPGGGIKKTSMESSNTMEKHSWSSKQESSEKYTEKPITPITKPIIYNAETIKVDHTVNTIQEKSLLEKYMSKCDVEKTESSERKIEDFSSKSMWQGGHDLKAPGLVKSVEVPKKPVASLYRPQPSEPLLQPGSPPEIGYAPPPFSVEKKVERIEKTVDVTMDQHPSRIPPGGIRMMPPMTPKKEEPPILPPKDVRMTPPPIPAKQPPPVKQLEPFPFKPSSTPVVKGLPTPSKFVKSTFTQESDYESDFESHLKPKWRPYESDGDEPRFRHVKAPVTVQPTRPKSTEPEPLPPSRFEMPPSTLSGPLASPFTENYQEKICKKTITKRQERESKQLHQQQQPQQQHHIYQSMTQTTPPIDLKPGSPPIYVQPAPPKATAPKSPPAKKPESPKFKVKTFQQESGYMADTDEPRCQKSSGMSVQKMFGKQEGSTSSTTSHTESRTSYSESKFYESKSYESRQMKKETTSSMTSDVSASRQPIPKPVVQQTSIVEKSYSSSGTGPAKFQSSKETIYTTDQSQRKLDTTRKVQAPSASPSKFVKGEFRESDYESDYDSRIPPLWKPGAVRPEDQAFRPVKPNLAGPGKPKEPSAPVTPTPPVFEKTTPILHYDQRTKDQLVKKQNKETTLSSAISTTTTPTKQKTVLLPGSPPKLAFAAPPPQTQQTYYEGRSGVPFHNAVGTETKKTVRMDESTENTRRIVTVEQTSRVIKFGDSQKTTTPVISPDFGAFETTAVSQQQRQKQHYRVPTPKKFVQGQFRESDYESDVDTSRIRPKWTPVDSDTEDPRYRSVQPPTARSPRSFSAPVRQGQVISPMEFDKGVPEIKRQMSVMQLQDELARTKREDSQTTTSVQQRQIASRKDDEQLLKPGSPPEFGFVSRSDVKTAANHVASRHISDMTHSFKAKTEKFVSDIQSDLKQGKPILKHPVDTRTSDGDEPRTYREESRVSEHGTKQIDPDTGLIYFKYDFGYEFGIVLPGEGKKTITSTNNSIQGQRRASDIEVPIVHEFTARKENGFPRKGTSPLSSTITGTNRTGKPGGKYGSSKTVKWEPTSESEFSEAEDARNARKKYTGGGTSSGVGGGGSGGSTMPPPPSLIIPCSPSPSRWDHTTPSPLSLSPSLPSLSPRYSSATGPPSNVDSAGSPWPTTNGIASSKEVIQPYLDVLQKKAPMFITPLRDIAVVSGQTARFECIVQAEPQPNILWSKDGRIIENSSNYEIHYRNGVCRLTISRAFPEDAGLYACTATNGLGSTVTSSTLQVPGNRRSIYAPI